MIRLLHWLFPDTIPALSDMEPEMVLAVLGIYALACVACMAALVLWRAEN